MEDPKNCGDVLEDSSSPNLLPPDTVTPLGSSSDTSGSRSSSTTFFQRLSQRFFQRREGGDSTPTASPDVPMIPTTGGVGAGAGGGARSKTATATATAASTSTTTEPDLPPQQGFRTSSAMLSATLPPAVANNRLQTGSHDSSTPTGSFHVLDLTPSPLAKESTPPHRRAQGRPLAMTPVSQSHQPAGLLSKVPSPLSAPSAAAGKTTNPRFLINLPVGHMGAASQHNLITREVKVSHNAFVQQRAVEIIPQRLLWLSVAEGIAGLISGGGGSPSSASVSMITGRYHKAYTSQEYYAFCVDDHLVYEPFFADFGPLNLGQTFRYCEELVHLVIVHYCSNEDHKKMNSAYLMAAFCVLILRWSAEAASSKFENLKPPLVPFRDATYGLCYYSLTLNHCASALVRATAIKRYFSQLGWFDYWTFDIVAYEFYEKLENGDLNWIIPKKFVAFSAPEVKRLDCEQLVAFTPEDYVPIFKQLGVKLVIRLNKRQYDRRAFTNHGIHHVDLYFLDGSCPSSDILNRFFEVTERCQDGAIAVHCKAGLGRTGTLIGCYAIKHFGFTGPEWIAWNRICRPGSVLGPQQDFLSAVEREFKLNGLRTTTLTTTSKFTAPDLEKLLQKMSIDEKAVAVAGDLDQGRRLVCAKRQQQTQTQTLTQSLPPAIRRTTTDTKPQEAAFAAMVS